MRAWPGELGHGSAETEPLRSRLRRSGAEGACDNRSVSTTGAQFGGWRPPTPDDQVTRTGSRRAVGTIVVAGSVLILLAILGFIVLAHGEDINSDVTVTLGSDGAPEIIAVSCVSRGIARVDVIRDRDGAMVFTAKVKPSASPRPSLSLSQAPDPDYDKSFPLGPLDPDTIYVPSVLEDEQGVSLGVSESAFKPSALRPDAADGGFTHEGRPLPSVPLVQWRKHAADRVRCG